MIAVNHHTLCQLIPLTETCNLSFGLIFCFFSSDFSEVTGEKRSSENMPPPHRLHTTSTHSGHAGSAPSSVSLLQLLLCFTQQEQPWGSSQDLSRAGDAFFFFFILVISPSSASPPASELVLTNVLSCQGSFLLSFWARLCYCRHFEYLTKIISIAVFKKILLDLVSPKLEYAEPKPNHLLERCLLPKQLGSISGSGTLLIHPTPRVLPAFSKHGCCIWLFYSTFTQSFPFVLTDSGLSWLWFSICDSSPFPFKSRDSSLTSMTHLFWGWTSSRFRVNSSSLNTCKSI